MPKYLEMSADVVVDLSALFSNKSKQNNQEPTDKPDEENKMKERKGGAFIGKRPLLGEKCLVGRHLVDMIFKTRELKDRKALCAKGFSDTDW